jgi:hydrophobe/amphiphile efflux-1 (HAE1) family protein
MFCRFFILRPVLSIVISLIILLAGSVAIWASPIAQYPDITPPSITVSATFPGANSETIANTVTAPLEDSLSGVSNMIYMTSASANASNQAVITIYFDIGTNLNLVLSDVLNRINTALRQMPQPVQQQGIVVRKSSPDLFLVISLYTDNGYPDIIYLSNYVYRYIYPIVNQINGVGSVGLAGNRNFAMRVIVDPNKLAYYNLSASDISLAIQEQNRPYAIGLMGMAPTDGGSKFQFMINTLGYLSDVKQFEDIILRANQTNNQIVHLRDVAQVKLEGQTYTTNVDRVEKSDGVIKVNRNVVALLLYLTPGANQLATKQAVSDTLMRLAKHFPAGIKHFYNYDATVFVKASITQVVDTFRDAFILVFLVILLFIQNLRGTIIPMIAIPVSIIGTFAGTYILGFSINTLTLFGVVLAIGIVVDDAIIVLENVERLMEEEKLTSVDAAIKAMEEVASPVIAIVLVLNSVFLPVAFLGGFAGVLYKQFAVTIAISVFLSGIVALTLTPTLCALFLKDKSKHKPKPRTLNFLGRFVRGFNQGFEATRHRYLRIVEYLIDQVTIAYILFIGVVAVTIGLYIYLPTSLVPLEDMGYYYSSVNLPSAASLDRTTSEASKLAQLLVHEHPVVQALIISGLDILDGATNKTNAALVVTLLKPWSKRSKPADQVDAIIAKTNKIGYMNKGANYFAFNAPPIRGLSQSGGVTFYLQSATNVTVKEIYADSVKVVNALKKHPAVGGAMQFYDVSVPELYIDLDRDKAKLYGLNIIDIFTNIQAIFGTYYVNYFTQWEDLWWVIMQSDYKYRKTPELLNTIYMKSADGKHQIPLGTLAKISFKNGAEIVTRFNDYLASQIIVNPNSGYTSGDVMNAVTEVTDSLVGKKYIVQWFGPAYQQARTGSSSGIAFVLGLIMVFLILAALYELWGLPLSVIMAVPFALFGAAVMLFIVNRPNDIFFQVSLITLLGLSAKNAILIVEFALDAYRSGKMTAKEAALEGARIRFRPIIMTSFAFILGALPLAVATGAGANSQHSVGTGIIGGMLGSTFLAILFIPLFFTTFVKFSKKKGST